MRLQTINPRSDIESPTSRSDVSPEIDRCSEASFNTNGKITTDECFEVKRDEVPEVLHKVIGDGNCYFRALSQSFYGD